jgi:hypothetical protein
MWSRMNVPAGISNIVGWNVILDHFHSETQIFTVMSTLLPRHG